MWKQKFQVIVKKLIHEDNGWESDIKEQVILENRDNPDIPQSINITTDLNEYTLGEQITVQLGDNTNDYNRILNLYEVSNGYCGDGPVHVLVIAPNEIDACDIAKQMFIKNAALVYPETYYNNLEVSLILTNTNSIWCSEVEG